ncbi:isoprenyl transferase [Rhodovibrio salinarum]|uniref:Isoprenyl transferase n=1 Tax=Rhodovibrio salinarum TaxID=1087 RepID=A0A934V0N7_9PROT|nr:isoprenyl transferase [Rhodovibrio salinarum]MBK1697811.1 isoprenyl transferase [Rhodovibrio salinarum]
MDGTSSLSDKSLPQHIAVIMDGNGRWAHARGLPRTAGHRQGAEAVRRVVERVGELGVPYLTVFGFSAENWKRPASEIEDLMWLLRRYLKSEVAELHKNDVRFQVIGDRTRFGPDLRQMLADAEASTADNGRLTLTLALNYGGRQDIVDASRKLAQQAATGALDPEAIDPERFAGALSTAGMPDPDMLIRTSGEQRISNFLLWQCAYAELFFLDKLWPDMAKDDVSRAVQEYQRRERRYGAAVGSR